jgi:RES domain-containing protein
VIEVVRLVRADYKDAMWSGEGGLHVDGRWHTPGRRIVYTSQSLSLAQLEVLVHISDRRQLPKLVYATAEIPDDVTIEAIDAAGLPANWRQFAPYSVATQRMGMQWLTATSSAVLKVPSAVSEGEWNFLLNPAHAEFAHLKFGRPKEFAMDARVP